MDGLDGSALGAWQARRAAKRPATPEPRPPTPDEQAEAEAERADQLEALRQREQARLDARITYDADGQPHEFRWSWWLADTLRPYITLVGCGLAICAAAWAGKNLLNGDQLGLIVITAVAIAGGRWIHHRT